MAPALQRRAQRLFIIALVVVSHAFVFGILVRTGDSLRKGPESRSLSLLYLAPEPEDTEIIRADAVRLSPPVQLPTLSVAPAMDQSAADSGSAPPGEDDRTLHSPVDWALELNRAADKMTSEPPAPKLREFGAPHVAPAPASRRPEFGWKRSRTNRLEKVSEGTTVHLGDRCVITVTPLPIVSCTPDKKQANGELFEHMRDPIQEGEGGKLP